MLAENTGQTRDKILALDNHVPNTFELSVKGLHQNVFAINEWKMALFGLSATRCHGLSTLLALLLCTGASSDVQTRNVRGKAAFMEYFASIKCEILEVKVPMA